MLPGNTYLGHRVQPSQASIVSLELQLCIPQLRQASIVLLKVQLCSRRLVSCY